MDMRIPTLEIDIMLESNPMKSRISVWRLAVQGTEKRERENGREWERETGRETISIIMIIS